MKKILALLLAILMALTPILATATPSPTVANLIRNDQAITYQLVNYDDSWWALMSDYQVSLEALADYFSEYYIVGTCSFDEAMWIECPEAYEWVQWSFMREYMPFESVCMILIDDQTMAQSFIWGDVQPDGSVLFDWSSVAQGSYLTFVFSGVLKTARV